MSAATKKAKKPGQPAATIAPTLLEIATVDKDIFFPAYFGILHRKDDPRTSRGKGKGLKIYDELERDGDVFGDLQKRKLAVIARPWQVNQASDDALDIAAADMVRRQFEEINFDNLCLNLLDGLLKGYAVAEVMWDAAPAEIVATELIPRDQRRFTFDKERKLRMLTLADLVRGEELPDRKFIVHSYGAKDANPFGLGLGTRLFWPVFFKRQDITFWLTFCDKFGSPTAVGKYPPGSVDADKSTLKAALAAIAQETGVIIPDGMAIELLEASRTGSTDAYEKLARYMGEQISKIILGEAESARAKGGALAAAANTRNEVRLELTQADSDLLCDTLNKSLVRWLVAYNMPGARPPKVWRDISAEEDLNQRADRDVQVYGMGFKPTLKYIKETYGEGWEERSMTTAAASVASGQAPPFAAGADPAFAEGANGEVPPDQAALDKALAAIPAAALQAQVQQMLAPVIRALNESKDATEALGKLADLDPKLDTSRLEDLLAQAIYGSAVCVMLN